MHRNQRWFAWSAVVGVVGVWWAVNAQESRTQTFMRAKLEHSQKVLEGLAMEDFEAIEKGARSLGTLAQAASWQTLQTPDYAAHTTDFLRLTRELESKAREKNIDGAALAYVQLTINCVNCHKHVRKTKIT